MTQIIVAVEVIFANYYVSGIRGNLQASERDLHSSELNMFFLVTRIT